MTAKAAVAWYVYLARCSDGSLYTGVAKDVAARIAQHDAGKGAKYTRGRGPLELCAKTKCAEHGDALRLERRIKALPREEKMELVKRGRLTALAKSFLAPSTALAVSLMCICPWLAACDTPAPSVSTGPSDAEAAKAQAIAAYLARDAAASADAGNTAAVICTPGPTVDFHGDSALETEVRRKLGRDKPGAPSTPITEADLGKIRSINLSTAHEAQLDPCVYPKLTILRDLFVGGGDLVDLRPIANLVDMRTVVVSNTKVDDLTPLTKLLALDRLDIGHTAVHDLSVLVHLTNLTELSIDGTLITDLSPLSGLTLLQKVSMINTPVSDIGPLKGAKNLRFLYIAGSSVHDLTPLAPQVGRGLKIIQQ